MAVPGIDTIVSSQRVRAEDTRPIYSAVPPPVRRSSCDAEGKGIIAALRLHVAFIPMCNYMRVTSGPRYSYVCYCMSICPRSQQSLKPQSTGAPSPLSALVPAPRRRSIRRNKNRSFRAHSTCGARSLRYTEVTQLAGSGSTLQQQPRTSSMRHVTC